MRKKKNLLNFSLCNGILITQLNYDLFFIDSEKVVQIFRRIHAYFSFHIDLSDI